MDCFLYGIGLRHERVKNVSWKGIEHTLANSIIFWFWKSFFNFLLFHICRLKPTTLLKLTLFHGCFSRFLNCTNGIKLRKVPHITKKFHSIISITHFTPLVSILPESMRKPLVSSCFQRVQKQTSGMKWVQKTCFLMLSEGTETDQWHEISSKSNIWQYLLLSSTQLTLEIK